MSETKKFNHPDATHENFDITDFLVDRKEDVGLFIIRLAIGGLMLVHGMSKLLYGTEDVQNYLMGAGLPAFLSFGVFVGEVLAPVMLIVGYKVRLAGFLIAVDMLMATLLVHASNLNEVNALGGWMLELNALYFLGSIAIMFLGPGRIALSRKKGSLD